MGWYKGLPCQIFDKKTNTVRSLWNWIVKGSSNKNNINWDQVLSSKSSHCEGNGRLDWSKIRKSDMQTPSYQANIASLIASFHKQNFYCHIAFFLNNQKLIFLYRRSVVSGVERRNIMCYSKKCLILKHKLLYNFVMLGEMCFNLIIKVCIDSLSSLSLLF